MSFIWELRPFSSQIGTKQWRYYDFGPKVVPPLICLPGTAGTAEVYYKQIMSLSMKVITILGNCSILLYIFAKFYYLPCPALLHVILLLPKENAEECRLFSR